MKKILFVCLGNICRSPLAEGVARKYIEENGLDLYIDSAGTSNWHEGETPCDNSVRVAGNYGVDISAQRSRPITKEDIEKFDCVVAMDEENRKNLENFGFTKIYKLGDFGGYDGENVPDPYFFKGFEGFEKVFKMVERCVEDLLEKKC